MKKTELLHRVAEVAEHSLAMQKIQQLFPDALTVADATEERMLLVTETDVKRGIPNDPSACAVAQCAQRQGLGGMIGRQFAFLIEGARVTRYQLGKDAQVRTALFDDRGTTKPGPVLLSVPRPSDRLGNMHHRLNVQKGSVNAKKKTTGRKTKRNRADSEKVRRSIVTHGFRSWKNVQAGSTA